MIKRGSLLFTAGVLCAAAIAIVNPANILTQGSERFSRSEFDRIKAGDTVESVVESLGEPLEIRNASPIGACSDCRVYLFLGEAPMWVFRYEEAWVLVDDRGLVVQKVQTSEP